MSDTVSSTEGVEIRNPLVAQVRQATLAMQRRDWEQGIVAQAFLELGERELVIQMCLAALIYQKPDGRVAIVGDGGVVDCTMLAEALLQAVAWTGDPALQAAEQGLREYLAQRAAHAPDGTYYHLYEQMWVDSFNCTPAYLTLIGEYDNAFLQIEGMRRRLWNADRKVFSHIWDEPTQRLENPNIWGVGNGWAAAGLTRVIRALPPERAADRERMVGYLRDLLDGCLVYQRPDGLFHNDIDNPETFIELNAAQMFAFAIYSGIAGGWLPESYGEAADRTRTEAQRHVDRHGIVRDVCGAPNFDRSGFAPEGQAFFLMMEAAYAKLHMGEADCINAW